MKKRLSKPAASTISVLKNSAVRTAKPVTEPVADLLAVSQALARAGEALIAAANALQGRIVLSEAPATEPPKPPPPIRIFEGDLSIGEGVNAFLVTKAKAERSERYLRQIRISLASFAYGRSGMPLRDVTPKDVEDWLFRKSWGASTMRSYLTDVRTFFNWCVKRGHLEKNRATAAIELPDDKSRHEPVTVHTPAQVRTMMEFMRHRNLHLMRMMAIRYFAGLRTAEVLRIGEPNIMLDRGYIEVPSSMAKTRRRRLVEIHPVLRAWLDLGGTLDPIHESTLRDNVFASGVKWEKNVARHSFCSYHLAMWDSASKTALQAGHTEEMLFKHYRAVVSKEDAKAFWNLFPTKTGSEPT